MTEKLDAASNKENFRSRNIVLGLGSLTVQNIVTSGMGFVFLAILLRLLPTVQYGVYSAVIIAVGLASSVSGFGLNQTVARYVALLRERDENSSWVVAREILYLSLILTTVTTVVYSIFAPSLSIYFTKTTQWTGIFLLGGVYLFLSPLTNVTQGIIQGWKKYVLLAKIAFISKLATVLVSIAALFVYRNVSIAIASWILLCTVSVGWVLALTFRNLVRASGTFPYYEILKYTYPLGVAGIVSILSSSSDLVVVGGFLSAFSLGVYSAAVTLSGVLTQVLVVPLTTALLPEFSSSKGVVEISNGLRLALRFIALIVMPASLFVTAVSSQLISLFAGGGNYLGGTSSLELISMFFVFTAIQTSCLVLFQAIGKTRLVLFVGLVTATTDLGAAVILVPIFGLVGAAVTKVLVGSIGAVFALYFSKEYLGALDGFRFYGKSVLSSIIAFVPTFFFAQHFQNRILTMLPCSVIFLAVFLVCARILKLLSAEDRSFLVHIIPGSLQKYVKYF